MVRPIRKTDGGEGGTLGYDFDPNVMIVDDHDDDPRNGKGRQP